jgi:hypothetical protein
VCWPEKVAQQGAQVSEALGLSSGQRVPIAPSVPTSRLRFVILMVLMWLTRLSPAAPHAVEMSLMQVGRPAVLVQVARVVAPVGPNDGMRVQ